MNDCPRQNPAYRSVAPDLRKNPLRRVFLFIQAKFEPLRTKIQEKAKEAAQTKDESAENMQRYENLRLMAEQPSIDPKELSKVEAPTLVIVGTQDLIEGAHTKLIYSSLPNAELVFVQGDHFIAYDNPVAFISVALWNLPTYCMVSQCRLMALRR